MFRSGDPTKGSGRVTWLFDRCLDTKPRRGYVAGDCVWVEVHFDRRSIPCVARLTNGELLCKHCQPLFPLMWLGYLPLYSDSHRPVLIGLQDYCADQVRSFELHDQVIWGRANDDKHAPVKVIRKEWGPKFTTTRPDRRCKVNIWPALLTIWKDAELKKLYELTQQTPETKPAQPAPTLKEFEEQHPKVIAWKKRQEEIEQTTAEQADDSASMLVGQHLAHILGPAAKRALERNGKQSRPKPK